MLREERAKADLSLADLADRTGIPVVSVQRYLAATRRMTMNTLDALCTALDLDIVAVFVTAEERVARDQRDRTGSVDGAAPANPAG